MDIQVASNFERYLYYRAGGDAAVVRGQMEGFASERQIKVDVGSDGVDRLIKASRGDTAATLATIRSFHQDYGYLLDPHTAVGVYAGEQHLDAAVPMICLATAHPAKFSEAITRATGEDLAHHPLLDGLGELPTRLRRVSASKEAVAAIVEEVVGK